MRSDTCILIPTYNNERTLLAVIESVLENSQDVIVINDGSTDCSAEHLATLGDKITLISYEKNRGKGYALVKGFRKATEMGFRYAISIDSDGQHKPEDIERFIAEAQQYPDSIIIGGRKIKQAGKSSKSSFANRISNLCFFLQTFQDLPDTQSGYRLYPLRKMNNMPLLTNRYECELEVLVRAAWQGIPLRNMPIEVYYLPREERVSHFRPCRDFLRITLFNTAVCVAAVFYGYPRMAFRALFK